ncbi:c-type cytochrome biogenesis protein CcmI [Rhizobacter sp. AJA081-3]|uniref:c-type cytochrome biogenesis protein CcmI n=1 Tax=Rhizobacter sp. AJA081-3 TaxID=2753607 RepID=UPI001ADF4B0F|nr:c-type cytochrome biogenesis protein CcmI [Rhizobacter sp. AJA081-3]QTN23823.1 c-type cytochrome biogenesis protein CcmI [Rhizobacter sp. AJA081-3]
MTVFWSVVALLLGGALLMLLPPLWRSRAAAEPVTRGAANLAVYRDQWREAEQDLGQGLLAPDQIEPVREDIQRRWLEDAAAPATPALAPALPAAPRAARRSAIALGLLLPLASVLTYLALGEPGSLVPVAPPAAPAPGEARHSLTPEQIQARVAALSERLKAEPGNAEGWVMLGRSYVVLGRYRDAATAWRRAADLLPANATLLADLADVSAMAQGKRLAGEPARLIQQALDADPRHVKALALAGSAAFEARDPAAARGYWERVLALVPPDSDIARSVQGSIAQATRLEAALSAAASPASPAPATVAGAIGGEVSLSPALAARVAAGDTLFVFARAAEGPRMPLAIVRRPVGEWPAAFTLDDSMAMAPNLKLSGFAQVVVSARISRSGNATPQPGDLIGQSAPVAPGVQGLRIAIDAVQP